VPTGVIATSTTDVAIRRFADRDHNITHWTEVERAATSSPSNSPRSWRGRPRLLRHLT